MLLICLLGVPLALIWVWMIWIKGLVCCCLCVDLYVTSLLVLFVLPVVVCLWVFWFGSFYYVLLFIC